MSTIFYDLLSFFGITAEAPTNLSELFPWLFSILVCIGLFLFVFSMIRQFTNFFGRGKF